MFFHYLLLLRNVAFAVRRDRREFIPPTKEKNLDWVFCCLHRFSILS